jgi:Fe-S cluster biogenesis protein NfuA
MNHPEDIKPKVEDALNQIRPYLEADGGNVSLIEITADHIVKLELQGACKTCSMSMMTLKAGIEETIRRAVPDIKAVEAVNIGVEV